MANPRDHIRAAQAAELRADKAGAIAELRKAAELFRRAGNLARALQLLRHAHGLDPSRDDVVEELHRFAQQEDASSARGLEGEDFESEAGVRELKADPDELAERQRLIEEALRQPGLSEIDATVEEEVKRWSVEEPPAGASRPVDLHAASQRALDWALRQGDEEEDRALSVQHASGHVTLEMRPLVEGDVTALVANVEVDSYAPASVEPAIPGGEEDSEREEAHKEAPSMFDRGPTRADPTIDAWCSFCCRPSVEVGALIVGPTGSFICGTCVTESRGLLALDDGTVSARPRASRRKEMQASAMPLIGQEEARALLERALQAEARRLIVIGPEGCGKTVWFRELAIADRGTLATLDTLEQGGGGSVVLVEDVDRFMTEDWTRLGSWMARYPERTLVMSARGALEAPGLVLSGPSGSLPVFTTTALSSAVLDSIPLELLEQVQVALPLRAPTADEFLEIARKRLALAGSELSLSDEVLAAFAAEATNSPRAGHELNALLSRVLAGSWSLAGEEKKAPGRKAAGKGAARRGAAKKPGRRGRPKGSV
jgi:ClpX C4-type zinc finger